MLYDLYRYEPGYDLLFNNGRFTCAHHLTDSRPMNNNLVKLHRGVDNTVRFRVFNTDRKRQKVEHLRIKGTLINKENRERMLVVYGTPSCTDGIFHFDITEGQLMDVPAGFYDLVITGEEFAIPEQPGEILSTPFYTDTAENVRLHAEVTDSVEKAPLPTFSINTWTPTAHMVDGINAKLHYSSAIQAGRLTNSVFGTHTFTAKASNFRGKLFVFGSLEHIPPSPSNPDMWFPLDVDGTTNVIQFGPVNQNGRYGIFTGIDAWSFRANAMWIMFAWVATDDKGVPTPSFVDPILVLDDLSEAPNKLDRVELRS